MVRVVRSMIVQHGNVEKATTLLNEYRGYAESQNIVARVFGEPFGHLRRLHLHFDFPDAGAAEEWNTAFRGNERAMQMYREIDAIAESDIDSSLLSERKPA